MNELELLEISYSAPKYKRITLTTKRERSVKDLVEDYLKIMKDEKSKYDLPRLRNLANEFF